MLRGYQQGTFTNLLAHVEGPRVVCPGWSSACMGQAGP